MASLTITGLQDHVSNALRERARTHGWSLEEEVRAILEASVDSDPAGAVADGSVDIVRTIRRELASVGGIDLELPKREPLPDPIQFKDDGSV